MTYYADLTEHSYTNHRVEEGVLNVGWLDIGEKFKCCTEDIPELKLALAQLCKHPINRHRGSHTCQFCNDELGNGQIRIQCNHTGVIYCAPTMIAHYVNEHNYCPPNGFITAALETLN